MSLAIISHPDCRLHDAGPDHPECADRLDAIQNQLISSGLDYVVRHYDAPEAGRADLERVHDPAYLDRLFALGASDEVHHIDDETVISSATLKAALRAAGAPLLAVDLVMDGRAGAAFCLARPPGHHAEADRAMGFCLFNNIAVGAAYALEKHNIGRIAIIDFDVHHGNGTEHIFAGRPDILFCSAFQHPFYPYSGDHTEAANVVNVPLAAGTKGADYLAAVEARWRPALDNFAPELVMISAGFDAHVEDEMSGLFLREADYGEITLLVREVADRHAAGRIVSVLEGGYALSALGRSVVAHLKALMG